MKPTIIIKAGFLDDLGERLIGSSQGWARLGRLLLIFMIIVTIILGPYI